MFDWGLHPNTSRYRCRDIFKHHNTQKYLKTQISMLKCLQKKKRSPVKSSSSLDFCLENLPQGFSFRNFYRDEDFPFELSFPILFNFSPWMKFYFWNSYPWGEVFIFDISIHGMKCLFLKFLFLGWSFYFWHFYPWDENFLFEIFTSLAAEGGPKLLCVVIGNISQEDILDNLPPENLKDERFFRKKYLT